MSFIALSIESDVDSARTRLEVLLDRLERLEPIYRDIGEIVRESIHRNFAESRSPEGEPWPPLKGGDNQGRKPLIKSGNLLRSVQEQAGADSVTVRTNAAYAAIHQFGGKAGRGRETVIPARSFMGVRSEDWTKIEAAILRHLGQ